jgi:hypothetical protein
LIFKRNTLRGVRRCSIRISLQILHKISAGAPLFWIIKLIGQYKHGELLNPSEAGRKYSLLVDHDLFSFFIHPIL